MKCRESEVVRVKYRQTEVIKHRGTEVIKHAHSGEDLWLLHVLSWLF